QDVLALQSEVTYGIARNIEIAVAAQGNDPAARAVAPAVYENYLKGRFELHKDTRAGFEGAVQYFQAAINVDSNVAPPYAGIADAYDGLGTVFFGTPPADARPKVIASARKALELDPKVAEARTLLAQALQEDWQWAEAETEFRRAIDLNPSDADAYDGLANWL